MVGLGVNGQLLTLDLLEHQRLRLMLLDVTGLERPFELCNLRLQEMVGVLQPINLHILLVDAPVGRLQPWASQDRFVRDQ